MEAGAAGSTASAGKNTIQLRAAPSVRWSGMTTAPGATTNTSPGSRHRSRPSTRTTSVALLEVEQHEEVVGVRSRTRGTHGRAVRCTVIAGSPHVRG